jgi:ribonuclease VapC
MVVDSSALVAILIGEPERDLFIDAIAGAPGCVMSAFNHFETRTVLLRRGGAGPLRLLGRFLASSRIELRAFDMLQAQLAFEAYESFGKGSGHKAHLNLGDCAAYALASSLDLPLLYKGNDFVHTDVRTALT